MVSNTFDIHKRPFRSKLAEQQALLAHHPHAILREIEICNNTARVYLTEQRTRWIPHMDLLHISTDATRKVDYRTYPITTARINVSSFITFDAIGDAHITIGKHSRIP